MADLCKMVFYTKYHYLSTLCYPKKAVFLQFSALVTIFNLNFYVRIISVCQFKVRLCNKDLQSWKTCLFLAYIFISCVANLNFNISLSNFYDFLYGIHV